MFALAVHHSVAYDTWHCKKINSDCTLHAHFYRFVLGGYGVSQDKLHQLELESAKHGDMVILPTVTDSLTTLTQRTLYGFKYAYERYKFDYVLKCDDDDFIDVLRLATELHKRPTKGSLYWGAFRGNGKILFLGLYRERQWSICKKYLPYAFGGGYIVSRDLVQLLVQCCQKLGFYPNIRILEHDNYLI